MQLITAQQRTHSKAVEKHCNESYFGTLDDSDEATSYIRTSTEDIIHMAYGACRCMSRTSIAASTTGRSRAKYDGRGTAEYLDRTIQYMLPNELGSTKYRVHISQHGHQTATAYTFHRPGDHDTSLNGCLAESLS